MPPPKYQAPIGNGLTSSLVVLLACGLAQVISCAPTRTTLARVCDGDKVSLTGQTLGALLDQPAGKSCSEQAIRAIEALSRLLTSDESLCSQAKAAQIADYFHEFVESRRAPVAVELLFVSYGLRVSELCRRRAAQLILATQHLLSEPEAFFNPLSEFNQWTGDASAMATVLPKPRKYAGMAVPKALTSLAESSGAQFYAQAPFGRDLRAIQAVCERRLKPIYEPLLMPLIQLARLGFNYKHLEASGAQLAQLDAVLFQWYRAVLLCESLAKMTIVNIDKPDSAQMEAFRARNVSHSDRAEFERQQTKHKLPTIKRVVYSLPELDSNQLDEPIVDLDDKQLSAAVDKILGGAGLARKTLGKMLHQFKGKKEPTGTVSETDALNGLLEIIDQQQPGLVRYRRAREPLSKARSAMKYGLVSVTGITLGN